MSHAIRFSETIPGGWNFSHVLKRHTTLRITDLEGRANASAMLYNFEHLGERLNIPDSLKSQHTAFFTTGITCQSDCGRVLASITNDSCGWHDALCGLNNAEIAAEKYGDRPYHAQRNEYVRNGYDSMLVELGKWGLGKRDMVAPINFFSKVTADEHGALSYIDRYYAAGAHVDLRAEINTLVVLSTCPHPLDPNTEYQPGPIQIEVLDTPPPAADDLCRTSCEQNGRAFHNTERYFL